LEADLSNHVILGPDGRVIDGMHRIARALLGEPAHQFNAVQLARMPEPDYRDCRPEETSLRRLIASWRHTERPAMCLTVPQPKTGGLGD